MTATATQNNAQTFNAGVQENDDENKVEIQYINVKIDESNDETRIYDFDGDGQYGKFDERGDIKEGLGIENGIDLKESWDNWEIGLSNTFTGLSDDDANTHFKNVFSQTNAENNGGITQRGVAAIASGASADAVENAFQFDDSVEPVEPVTQNNIPPVDMSQANAITVREDEDAYGVNNHRAAQMHAAGMEDEDIQNALIEAEDNPRYFNDNNEFDQSRFTRDQLAQRGYKVSKADDNGVNGGTELIPLRDEHGIGNKPFDASDTSPQALARRAEDRETWDGAPRAFAELATLATEAVGLDSDSRSGRQNAIAQHQALLSINENELPSGNPHRPQLEADVNAALTNVGLEYNAEEGNYTYETDGAYSADGFESSVLNMANGSPGPNVLKNANGTV